MANITQEKPQDNSRESGTESKYRSKGLPEEGPALIVRNQNCLLGCVRRASLVLERVFAAVFAFLCASWSEFLYQFLCLSRRERRAIWKIHGVITATIAIW